ncbi:palmitoyltransferase akr1-like [Lathyrus oleraceus]|uniref:palmitoyltransferase akr1-like n=1 Tax=Pisum sativum TaxID=3888 RepID=UPI001FC5FB63|nr:palmitoyltransferase akr1-like [Pisum sativum]
MRQRSHESPNQFLLSRLLYHHFLQVSTTDEVNTTNFSIKTDNATIRHNVDDHENWKRVRETALPITNLFSAKDWYNSMKTVEAIKDANKRGALHFAALEGQTEICKYLLEDLKLEIDSRDDDGETDLIHAARQGHTATTKYLIDHGADPTIASNLGATALHHSAGIGDIELLEHLPSKGINPDLESDAGTPLVWAAGHAQQAAVTVLLKHGANPNAETDDGITPLLSSVAAGSLECLELLIQVGAKVNASRTSGKLH